MRVLILGATGFIGRQVVARLLPAGHQVVAGIRRPATAQQLPDAVAVRWIDLNRLLTPRDWEPHLQSIDAVVNCAGILQSSRRQSAKAIHETSPIALFDACVHYGISDVVHISAVSADPDAGTEYALTRKAAEDHLCGLDLDWVLLRPSLVYGHGSGGGTSAIRGLAGFPFITPVPGAGQQVFSPIHLDDLAETVLQALERRDLKRSVLEPCGPDRLTLAEIVTKTRRWLGFGRTRVWHVPDIIIVTMAKIGDWVGTGPIRSTSLKQMAHGNAADFAAFRTAIGFSARSMDQAFALAPANVQDRWHARLWFAKPLLGGTLALLWMISGLLGLFRPPQAILHALADLGLPTLLIDAIQIGTSVADLIIGLLLAAGRGGRKLAVTQIGLVGAYTIALTVLMPSFWIDPLGPVLKNLPIIVAILIWAALLERD